MVRECTIHFGNVKIFTDCSITLTWIKSSSHSFKTFLSARVGEIQNIIRNVEVDNIVVMADNNAIHGKWTIRNVNEVHPVTDG